MAAKVEKIRWGHYLVNGINVNFSRTAWYDTFDGKYHPGWFVHLPHPIGVQIAVDKKSAFALAEKGGTYNA